jgi:hypothetical protein
MTDDKHKREGQTGTPAKNHTKDPGKDPGNNPHRDRLKLALRENLKRRKSQARGRSDVTTPASNDGEASPHDVSGRKPGE